MKAAKSTFSSRVSSTPNLRFAGAIVISAEALFSLLDLCGLDPEDAIASIRDGDPH